MASAKKRHDGEVTQKIKEREQEVAARSESFSSFSLPSSHLQENRLRSEIEPSRENQFENFSDSNSDSVGSGMKKDQDLDDSESGDDANVPLVPDRPSSGASAENGDSESEKSNRQFKSLIYGVCKAKNQRTENSTPGSYTSQFSMCSGNMLSGNGMPYLNSGLLSSGKNSSSPTPCGLGNKGFGSNHFSNLYGSNSPVVGPISMDSIFGSNSMLQSGLVGDSDLQKF